MNPTNKALTTISYGFSVAEGHHRGTALEVSGADLEESFHCKWRVREIHIRRQSVSRSAIVAIEDDLVIQTSGSSSTDNKLKRRPSHTHHLAQPDSVTSDKPNILVTYNWTCMSLLCRRWVHFTFPFHAFFRASSHLMQNSHRSESCWQ